MTEYLPSLQTYTFAAASVYFTYMTAMSVFNKISWYLADRRMQKEFEEAMAAATPVAVENTDTKDKKKNG